MGIEELFKQIRDLCERVEEIDVDPRNTEVFETQNACILMKDILNDHILFERAREKHESD